MLVFWREWCEFLLLLSGRFLTPHQTCLSQCPPGTFGNKTSGQCEGCSAGCAMCQEAHVCQGCHEGLYLQKGLCVEECQRCFSCCLSSWFAQTVLRSTIKVTVCFFHRGFPQGEVCHPCAPECGSCEESPSRCLSCESPLLLLDHSCLSSCPKGFYKDDAECHRCPDHCSECSQDGLCEGTCTQWSSGWVRRIQETPMKNGISFK